LIDDRTTARPQQRSRRAAFKNAFTRAASIVRSFYIGLTSVRLDRVRAALEQRARREIEKADDAAGS